MDTTRAFGSQFSNAKVTGTFIGYAPDGKGGYDHSKALILPTGKTDARDAVTVDLGAAADKNEATTSKPTPAQPPTGKK